MFSNSMGFHARTSVVAGVIALLAACGGGSSGNGTDPSSPAPAPTPAPIPTHTVGGTVKGLAGTLVLQNNAGDDLTISSDGKFSFATPLTEGSTYLVSTRTQPLWQFCTVLQGTGSASAEITNVDVDCQAAQATVTTIAGSGTMGTANGNGAAAEFAVPAGIAVDRAGKVMVVELASNRLRKIAPNGDVTTFAGDGSAATVDGNGTSASFSYPVGLGVSASGDMYVTQGLNGQIRKVTPSGDVTTFAGSGIPGTVDGNGTAASFVSPVSVSIDAGGNLYVVELEGHTVRKVTPAGDVTTFAGSGGAAFADGTGRAASFNTPFGSAVDPAGNVYVADSENRRIRRITPSGVVTTWAGSGTRGSEDGVGTSASFVIPTAMAADAEGNLYMSDGRGAVRRITTTGVVTTLAGSPTASGKADGVGAAASFGQIFGLAVDAAGHVYVADSDNHLIRKITPTPVPVPVP